MTDISRKERDKQIRKEDILKAAVRLFATKGYYNTTMADIARESQYAVGTLYLYFKNKEYIYLNLLNSKMDELLKTVQDAVTNAKTAAEKIKALVETRLSYFQKNIEFFKILFSEGETLHKIAHEDFHKRLFSKFRHQLEYMAKIIKEAQEENYIIKKLPTAKVTNILLGMIHSTFFPYLMGDKYEGDESDFQRESGLILKIFLEGAGSGK